MTEGGKDGGDGAFLAANYTLRHDWSLRRHCFHEGHPRFTSTAHRMMAGRLTAWCQIDFIVDVRAEYRTEIAKPDDCCPRLQLIRSRFPTWNTFTLTKFAAVTQVADIDDHS